MKVVTAGSTYMDIDAYAGCIAEAELLNLTGEQAYAASSATLNESIPASIRALGLGLREYVPSGDDEFILVDVSKEEFFDPIVRNGTVVEVIDHHPGQEQYWLDKIGTKADIEFIGAACTQIFERWEANDKLDDMKPEIAAMLAAGILDNTLNFNAAVTTDRDRRAYQVLSETGTLPADFAAQYFNECQQAIEQNFAQAIRNDVKEMKEVPRLPRTLGQLTVWDAKVFAQERRGEIAAIIDPIDTEWALNLISIIDGRSYIISNNTVGQKKMASLLGIEFQGSIAVTDRLWLRKELLKLALETSES